MKTIKAQVYYLLQNDIACRESANRTITRWCKLNGIKKVNDNVWGQADTVRRAWRYWINTEKAFDNHNAEERYGKINEYKKVFGR